MIPNLTLSEMKGQIANLEESERRWQEVQKQATENLLRIEGGLNVLRNIELQLEERIRGYFIAKRGGQEIVFPKDVRGWLTEEEGQALACLASGKKVLEIGSYCGRSTICMAQTAEHVHAVDTFDGRATPIPGPTLDEFLDNLKKYNITNVTHSICTSMEVPDIDPVDVVFIDGNHEPEFVRVDIITGRRLMKPDGLLVFHDYHQCWGVTKAVDELLAVDGEMLEQHGSIVVVSLKNAPCRSASVV